MISIGPILAVPGSRTRCTATVRRSWRCRRSCAARSSRGRPTRSCRAGIGLARGIAAHYAGLIDGFVADERASGVPILETDVLMDDAASPRRVARETLEFALALRG